MPKEGSSIEKSFETCIKIILLLGQNRYKYAGGNTFSFSNVKERKCNCTIAVCFVQMLKKCPTNSYIHTDIYTQIIIFKEQGGLLYHYVAIVQKCIRGELQRIKKTKWSFVPLTKEHFCLHRSIEDRPAIAEECRG